MTSLWLVRHGEAAAKWAEHPDPGLSELGQQQALAAADQLEPLMPPRVALVSSPKARAMETAAPLQQRLGAPLDINEAFIEIQAPVPLEDRQNWLRAFMGQGWSEQEDMLWQWREGIVTGLLALQQPTVVFTHFLVINAVIAHIRGDDRTLQVWPDNGSVHEIVLEQGALKVVTIGQEMATVVT